MTQTGGWYNKSGGVRWGVGGEKAPKKVENGLEWWGWLWLLAQIVSTSFFSEASFPGEGTGALNILIYHGLSFISNH